MNTSSFVRRFINNLEIGQLFTTKDVLHFGTRTSVDRTLGKLVSKGRIMRRAYGVFQNCDDTHPAPSPLEVATAKATSYGKEISIHGDNLLAQLKLAAVKGNSEEMKFWVDGGASSFRYGNIKIVFKPASARKIQLVKKGGPALSLVALWHLGEKNVTRSEISRTATYNNHERQQLKQSLNSVPQWLSRFYVKEPDRLHQYLSVEEYRDQLHCQSQLAFDCQHT